MTLPVPAVAVPAFAFTWWAACYLIGRDPTRAAGRAFGVLLMCLLSISGRRMGGRFPAAAAGVRARDGPGRDRTGVTYRDRES